MAESKTLVPVDQKEVEFYGDAIMAVRLAEGSVYIPVKPICDLLGVDWGGQFRRIQRDPVLSEETRSIDVTSTRRGTQPMVCLPLDYVSGFLFGLNADRVKTELRERVILYQRECYKVLAEAFKEGRLITEPTFDDLLATDSPAVQAYRMAQAIMHMARQQILLEARLEQQDGRLDSAEQRVTDIEERLENIEVSLGDSARHITPSQASRISQAVKAIALELGKRSGRNEFGGVYGEVYRRFEIAGYRELPAAKYDEAMRFLRDWYLSLTGNNMPF